MPVVRTPVKKRPFHAGSLARNREYMWAWVIRMARGAFEAPTLPKPGRRVVRIFPVQFGAERLPGPPKGRYD
jgi:hypothetical protein